MTRIALNTPLRRNKEYLRLMLRGTPQSSWGYRYSLVTSIQIKIKYFQVFPGVRASFLDGSLFSSTIGATQ